MNGKCALLCAAKGVSEERCESVSNYYSVDVVLVKSTVFGV